MSVMTMLTSILLLSSKNPVKMSMTILLVAISMFSTMWCLSGSSWFPSILTLLFTGGVLIMFMMLSSFHPNETSSKLAVLIASSSVLILFMVLMLGGSTHQISPNPSATKAWFQSHTSGFIMTTLILLYFIMVAKAMKKEESSMKMLMC